MKSCARAMEWVEYAAYVWANEQNVERLTFENDDARTVTVASQNIFGLKSVNETHRETTSETFRHTNVSTTFDDNAEYMLLLKYERIGKQ